MEEAEFSCQYNAADHLCPQLLSAFIGGNGHNDGSSSGAACLHGRHEGTSSVASTMTTTASRRGGGYGGHGGGRGGGGGVIPPNHLPCRSPLSFNSRGGGGQKKWLT